VKQQSDPDTSLPVDEPTEDHDESHTPELAPKDDGGS
jgi:hypothetical protein